MRPPPKPDNPSSPLGNSLQHEHLSQERLGEEVSDRTQPTASIEEEQENGGEVVM